MPEEWRRRGVPIFKNKGDMQSFSNYRGIKLMSHTVKSSGKRERVVEARLRKVVEICEQQYGFMPRKSTTDAIFALRILMEKYRDGQRDLHCVFVDLEKAYVRMPREELWYCMRKSGVAEKYVRVVQDMYERSRTVVRCAVGQTEKFNVEVGLHQGSALSPFLFAMVMDQLSEECYDTLNMIDAYHSIPERLSSLAVKSNAGDKSTGCYVMSCTFGGGQGRFSGFLPSPKKQAAMLEVEVVLEDMSEVAVVI
ncbi:hypothetical protein QTP86_006545 [Hemibagrus guttatus]|nr:hypothetical protein QTP86_006545 [Hemibagrus guttatus]